MAVTIAECRHKVAELKAYIKKCNKEKSYLIFGYKFRKRLQKLLDNDIAVCANKDKHDVCDYFLETLTKIADKQPMLHIKDSRRSFLLTIELLDKAVLKYRFIYIEEDNKLLFANIKRV
ncbi:MAG: hypothetical protein FWE37_01870 [Spirochaetaceae bacterium]|nr:hypothetical protein [Spirochaetaceae bacterium]